MNDATSTQTASAATRTDQPTAARTPRRATRRTARGVVVAGVPLLLAGLLVGCSSDPSSGSGSTGSSGTGTSDSSASDAEDRTDTASGSPTSSTGVAPDDASLLAAAATARDAVDSGTVVAIEQDQGGSAWEVLVVTADGTEHEVRTDAAGRSVLGQPVVDDTDADDRAEHQRAVEAADLDVRQAAERFAAVRAGEITELGLDDHLGEVVWEGDVVEASGARWSVRIDAGSGDVVTNERDTDD